MVRYLCHFCWLDSCIRCAVCGAGYIIVTCISVFVSVVPVAQYTSDMCVTFSPY